MQVATDKLLVVVGQETNAAEEQKAAANVEASKCEEIANEVQTQPSTLNPQPSALNPPAPQVDTH